MTTDRRDTAGHRSAPLDVTPEEFRSAGHELVDALADLLGGLRKRPVTRKATPEELRLLLPAGSVPEEGVDGSSLLRDVRKLLLERSLFNGHPRFFGYITSPAAPLGALADLLAAAVNANVGGWHLSPVASEIERQCVRWLGDLLGYRVGDGLLVSGGNVANVSGFLAARRAVAGEEVRRTGLARGGQRLVAYASVETHTWIQKAADLSGLGTDALRFIPTDETRRVDPAALRDAVAEDRARGDRPFLVVGTAGTVATGAIDPLDELAAIARESGAWFHVDGAYGALAVLVPEEAPAFAGLSEADSIAMDPHKWLYAPLEAGCLLVRDEGALRDTFAYTPSYYRFGSTDADGGGDDDGGGGGDVPGGGAEPTNYYERGLQNSRGFRALKVWLGLRQAGRAGYRQMIGDDIALARRLHERLATEPELEPDTTGLGITTFRYVPPGTEGHRDGGPGARDDTLDAVNESLLERLNESGEAFLSNAELDGRFFLRACVCNFRTTEADVDALPEIVRRHGRAACREMGLPGRG